MPFSGPDVRPWHEAVDWSQVAGAGHRLGWCPATTGIAGVDPRFESNWPAMAAAGMVRGAVHTLSTSYVGRSEARHFANVLGDPTGMLTAVAVQPDGHRLDDRLPAIEQVADFATEWQHLTGHPLIIRTSWRWWATRDAAGRGREISPYLWHAGGWLSPPRAWVSYGGWANPTIWGAPRSACAGVAGLCGLTLFTGHQDALHGLLGLEPAPEPFTRRLLRRIVLGGLKLPRRRPPAGGP